MLWPAAEGRLSSRLKLRPGLTCERGQTQIQGRGRSRGRVDKQQSLMIYSCSSLRNVRPASLSSALALTPEGRRFRSSSSFSSGQASELLPPARALAELEEAAWRKQRIASSDINFPLGRSLDTVALSSYSSPIAGGASSTWAVQIESFWRSNVWCRARACATSSRSAAMLKLDFQPEL